jgi:hypothetical protein
MASYALIKFKINNTFDEWEQSYYAAQPMARQAGIIDLFHGMAADDPQACFVLCHVPSKEVMDKFFEEAGEQVANSGHILESTEVTMLTN